MRRMEGNEKIKEVDVNKPFHYTDLGMQLSLIASGMHLEYIFRPHVTYCH